MKGRSFEDQNDNPRLRISLHKLGYTCEEGTSANVNKHDTNTQNTRAKTGARVYGTKTHTLLISYHFCPGSGEQPSFPHDPYSPDPRLWDLEAIFVSSRAENDQFSLASRLARSIQ